MMSRIGFGLGRFQATRDPELAKTYLHAIRTALDNGICILDTAPNYAHGLADLLLGNVLDERREAGLDNAEIMVCSKVGYPAADEELDAFRTADDGLGRPQVTRDQHCLAPDFIAAQLERSLERLGLPGVDILYLHNPEEQRTAFGRPVFEERLERALRRCGELQADGRIGAIGISCSQDIFDLDEPATFLDTLLDGASRADVKIEALQVPFSLSCPHALWPKDGAAETSLLEIAEAHALPVFASAALGGMRLPLDGMKQLAQLFEGVETPAHIAMQFARSAPGIACALFGSCNPAHVQHMAGLNAIPTYSFGGNHGEPNE